MISDYIACDCRVTIHTNVWLFVCLKDSFAAKLAQSVELVSKFNEFRYMRVERWNDTASYTVGAETLKEKAGYSAID